jgi:molybdopterin molybdotransferase
MVSVAEASRIIHERLLTPAACTVALREAVGYTLARAVAADRDFPPFNRVAMDGIAVAWRDNGLLKEYPVEHTQAAGEPAYRLKNPLACVEVMTGAVLPEGTDTVIAYEDLQQCAGTAVLKEKKHLPFQHVHRQGTDAAKGNTLLPAGTVVTPAEVAVMASVGIEQVAVWQLPSVALVSTGNELVEIDQQPEPHQVRISNAFALDAALQKLKAGSERYHVPDEADSIARAFGDIFGRHEVVILSGGVSKGKFDLIPGLLAAHGIEKMFHYVAQKPGKPFWFGRSARHTVFALPGNPVSAFLCFFRYIEPWLRAGLGRLPQKAEALLMEDVTFNAPLTGFLQVRTEEQNGQRMAYPVPGGGSGDFINLLRTDGFVELTAGQHVFKAGQLVPYIGFR